jgi:hypothetical protein
MARKRAQRKAVWVETTMPYSKVRETAWKKVPRAETKAEETRWEPGFWQSYYVWLTGKARMRG